jgi:hypothetical protein
MPVKMDSNGRAEIVTIQFLDPPASKAMLVCANPVPQADGSMALCGTSFLVEGIPTSREALDALKCDECRDDDTTT